MLEEPLKAGFVLGDIRIDFAPRAFKVDVADDCGAAVAGTGNVEHVEVVGFDDSV